MNDTHVNESILSEEILEDQKKNRIDHMTYLPGMEDIGSDVMDQVISAMNAYDYEKYTEADVRRAIAHDIRTPEDFAALLSPAALPLLEEIAQAAQAETRKHFGNSVYMFTPIYIANYCENYCIYCGFNCHNKINRAQLNAEEIEKEMEIWNIPVDYGKQHIKSEKKQNQQTAKRKVNSEVSWMDELRKRIQIAVQQTVSLADLEENLNRYGVAVIKKTKSNWTFQLWDGTEFQGKKARGDKISPDFIPSKLRKTIDLNYQNSPQARHKRRAQETEKICNRITGANTTKESYLHY